MEQWSVGGALYILSSLLCHVVETSSRSLWLTSLRTDMLPPPVLPSSARKTVREIAFPIFLAEATMWGSIFFLSMQIYSFRSTYLHVVSFSLFSLIMPFVCYYHWSQLSVIFVGFPYFAIIWSVSLLDRYLFSFECICVFVVIISMFGLSYFVLSDSFGYLCFFFLSRLFGWIELLVF